MVSVLPEEKARAGTRDPDTAGLEAVEDSKDGGVAPVAPAKEETTDKATSGATGARVVAHPSEAILNPDDSS